MYKLPPKYVGAYAEQDAVATLKLWQRLKIELEEGTLAHLGHRERVDTLHVGHANQGCAR